MQVFSFNMDIQILFEVSSVVTIRALVRLLARMGNFMPLEQVLAINPKKLFSAHFTGHESGGGAQNC